MSVQEQAPPILPALDGLSRGTIAALVTLLVGAACLLLDPYLPWLVKYPAEWAIPASDWIGTSLGWFLELIKPVMRVFSAILAYPMDWANMVFTGMPWPLMIGLVTALGWYIGGVWMAALGLSGLGFVVASGYWLEGMATLALVSVSVPLALLTGGFIGVIANEFPRFKNAIQTVLDVMQTVPTFAYLTPLLFLFGFGPVVGLIASAIYAAPPMARNVILGLERVESDIKEAAVMSGGTRLQQLFLIEIPSAKTQIMVGVNQCLMAALSMVIIAAVIGGFKDIGWEVLLMMRKAFFGPSLMAGAVIVVFAIIIDRYSGRMAHERERYDLRVALGIAAIGLVVSLLYWSQLSDPTSITLLDPVAKWLDQGLTGVLQQNGAGLDSLKNGAMFFGLLPLKIGLDGAVLPFTWGFQWTAGMSMAFYVVALAIAGLLAVRGRAAIGGVLVVIAGIIETGIVELPWPFVLVGAGALGWISGGRKLASFAVIMLVLILISGLWERALVSLYMSGASVAFCAAVGGAIGLLCAVSPLAWRVVQPICDMLQTIPLFVYLIPVIMFFQIGEFSAFLAICMYAIVPMIRYTRHGLINTPEELIEASISSGATEWQTMTEVRIPYAAPTILLGLNQTILYAFAMLVIAALVGTTGLGQSIYGSLAKADVGLGIASGAAMAILALVADRLVQSFAEERRQALGL
ncbi:ABC transporter permease [Roseovarius sp. 2305UL8-3]|uniref:ABC transporter permease n=1 Tax=Roseovarius conchicola TaxID=3121636 RepID=UPI0035279837